MNSRAVLDSWNSCACLEEGVGVALEQREVGVHAEPGWVGKGLGINVAQVPCRSATSLIYGAERHDIVRRGECVGVAKVDFVLAGTALVVAELHGDAHRLEHRDRLAAEVGAARLRGVVEEAAAVDRQRLVALPGHVLEEVELDLGVRVEGEAAVGRPLSVRLRTWRGSAYDGLPSGITMSQNIRAVAGPPSSPVRHGRIWNVEASGWASMSDS